MESQRELEIKIIRKFNERVLNCFSDIVILNQLEKQALSGYDLIRYVSKSYGILMSAGTVYAAMYSLERAGLVSSIFTGRKKLFVLTDEGKMTLEVIRDSADVKQFLIRILHEKLGVVQYG